MNKPNFFIVGAMKAGTTSLYEYLREHPEIFMPERKEPNYFVFSDEKIDFYTPIAMPQLGRRECHVSKEKYLEIFTEAGGCKAIGEGSTNYLIHPSSLSKIKDFNKDSRIIVVLRNPIERAYSAFNFHRMNGIEPIDDFEIALDMEAERVKKNIYYPYRYVEGGMYSKQLENLYKEFPKNQIAVYLFEDLKNDPQKVCDELYRFLGVSADFSPDFLKRHNVTVGSSRAVKIYRRTVESNNIFSNALRVLARKLFDQNKRSELTKKIKKTLLSNTVMPSPLSDIARLRLKDVFCEDIKKTSNILSRDLGFWL